MLPTPKKIRPAVKHPESVAEVISTVRAATKMKSVARVEAAAQGQLTVASLQAVIDENMRLFAPSLPRTIVTQKPFGVFRKRLEAAHVDVVRFVTFAIREWSALAAQNRAAYMKDPSKVKKGSPLPAAPSFQTLAYRLPYFLAAYANTEATGKRIEVADPRDAEISKLRKQLQDATAQVRSTSAVVRRIKETKQEEPPPSTRVFRRAPPPTARVADLSDDWTPPVWEPTTK